MSEQTAGKMRRNCNLQLACVIAPSWCESFIFSPSFTRMIVGSPYTWTPAGESVLNLHRISTIKPAVHPRTVHCDSVIAKVTISTSTASTADLAQ